jgi:hypothetical protein
MDCSVILAEVGANNELVKQLAADKGLKTTQDVAAGAAGIFIPVLWFGMDFQGTADTCKAVSNISRCSRSKTLRFRAGATTAIG